MGVKRRLRDVGFYVDERDHAMYGRPVKDFTSLAIHGSTEEIREVLELVVPDEHTGTHYWLDTSFLILPDLIYGHRRGRELKIQTESFLSAAPCGLESTYPKYREMSRSVKRIRHAHQGEIKRIVSRPDVTVIEEVIEEFERGIALKQSRMERINGRIHRDIVGASIDRIRDVAWMIRQQQTVDATYHSLAAIKKQEMANYCRRVADEEGINTSRVDNMLVTYAVLNTLMNEKEPQCVLTRDQGIVALLEEVSSRMENEAIRLRTTDRYHLPLKLYQIDLCLADAVSEIESVPSVISVMEKVA